MTARVLAIAGWLAAGHAVLAGLYWLLLAIPESPVAMLVASALTVLAIVLGFGWVEAVGLLAWDPDATPRLALRRALARAPGVWLGTALFVVVWFLTAHARTRWDGSRGEIDAWLIATFAWTNTGWLHTAAAWLIALVRFVGLSLAVSLAWAYARAGLRGGTSSAWIRNGLSPRRLLTLAGILVVFFWLPWRGVDWRPRWLAPNWQETTFVALKLGVLYLWASLGAALVLGVGRFRNKATISITDS